MPAIARRAGGIHSGAMIASAPDTAVEVPPPVACPGDFVAKAPWRKYNE